MKVCLIHPAQAVTAASASVNRPTLPLGMAYLAASLRQAGHEVQLIDAVGLAPDRYRPFKDRIQILGLSDEEILARIEPDVGLIGVGMMFSFNWPSLRPLLAEIKQRHPDLPLVLGGEAATSTWKICLDETPVDIVAQGEGEETVVELADACARPDWREHLASIQGISWRKGDGVVSNARRSRIGNIDEIAWPAWDLFDIRGYEANRLENGLQHAGAHAVIPMLATRGCPYECTFCTSPNMWTRRYLKRDPIDVVDEIEHNIKTYGATNFPFQDLTAIIDRNWILEFCREIIDRGLKIHWQLPSGTRSEVIDEEVAEHLYRSGMIEMGYAPEAGSDHIRKVIKKKVKRENLYASVRAATKHNLTVQVFFIIGFPHETRRDIFETFKMAAKLAWLGAHDVAMNHYMALPGTEITASHDPEWIRSLGDDFYFIPLFGHTLMLDDWRRANRRIGSLELSAYVLFGFALFYSISFARHPKKLWLFLSGLRSEDESSRLQAAIKNMLRIRSEST